MEHLFSSWAPRWPSEFYLITVFVPVCTFLWTWRSLCGTNNGEQDDDGDHNRAMQLAWQFYADGGGANTYAISLWAATVARYYTTFSGQAQAFALFLVMSVGGFMLIDFTKLIQLQHKRRNLHDRKRLRSASLRYVVFAIIGATVLDQVY